MSSPLRAVLVFFATTLVFTALAQALHPGAACARDAGLWNAGGGSMLLVVLAPLGIHLDNVSRGELMGDGVTPLVSTMVVLAIFAVVLVATGRLRADTAVTSTTA